MNRINKAVGWVFAMIFPLYITHCVSNCYTEEHIPFTAGLIDDGHTGITRFFMYILAFISGISPGILIFLVYNIIKFFYKRQLERKLFLEQL